MNVNLRDELQALSDVGPTRDLWADALARLDSRERIAPPSRLSPRAFGVAMVLAAVLAAAVVLGVVALSGHGGPTSPVGGNQGSPVGPGGSATLDQPLAPGARQVSLANASNWLARPLTLPDTSFVQPSDAGKVFIGGESASDGSAAVTFPSQGLIVRYERPAITDPLSNYQGFVKDSPGSQVVYLNGGVPALAIAELPDGSNWGSVEFVTGGMIIVVMGHNDEATLQSVAQSILDRNRAG